jgi:hypothetical protein
MMHQHSCAHVLEHLEAYHDGELTIDEQIAIQNHLGECVACSLAAEELHTVGFSLRERAQALEGPLADEPLRISARVIERLRVEEQFSTRAQVISLFQDMHLVWAGLGATVATTICVIGSASVLHAANQQHPNSMANVISILANPGSNENPVRLNYEMLSACPDAIERRTCAPIAVMAAPIAMSEEDAEYTLSAVVSKEGRVQGIEVIPSATRRGGAINAMLNDAYRTQFAPAQARGGDAVAVSMVWLLTSTTVKGRADENMQILRESLRSRTVPEPIAPLPIPVDAAPKPEAAPLKPAGSEAAHALAAGV